jgi:hypothetical protein
VDDCSGQPGHLPDTPADAATLLDKAISGRVECRRDPPRVQTLASWRRDILAHHDTGASNGPTDPARHAFEPANPHSDAQGVPRVIVEAEPRLASAAQ